MPSHTQKLSTGCQFGCGRGAPWGEKPEEVKN